MPESHARASGTAGALPLLVYDGDCGFCSSAVSFARRRIGPRCTPVAWQFTELEALGVPRGRAEREVLWITPTGSVYGGARAVAKLLLSAGGGWSVLGGALLALPPVRWTAQALYRVVAANRHRLPGGSPACALPSDGRAEPPSTAG